MSNHGVIPGIGRNPPVDVASTVWSVSGDNFPNRRPATDVFMSTFDTGGPDSCQDFENALVACHKIALQTGKARLVLDSRTHYIFGRAPVAGGAASGPFSGGQLAQVRLPFQQDQVAWIEIVGIDGGSWSTLPNMPGGALGSLQGPAGTIIESTYNPSLAVTNVALTSNVATLTVNNTLATGYTIIVTGLTNTLFNGAWTLTGATSTTVTFAKTHADVASTADSGSLQPGFGGYGVGLASVMGGPSSFTTAHVVNAGGQGPWSNTVYAFRNISFRLPTQPCIACLDLGFLRSCDIRDIQIDTLQAVNGTAFSSWVPPTNPQALGLQFPFTLMDSPATAHKISITGMHSAYGIGELLNAGELRADGCRLVLACDVASHPNNIDLLIDNNNINGIAALQPSTSGVAPFINPSTAVAFGSQQPTGTAIQPAPIRINRWNIQGGGAANSNFARNIDYFNSGVANSGAPYIDCPDMSELSLYTGPPTIGALFTIHDLTTVTNLHVLDRWFPRGAFTMFLPLPLLPVTNVALTSNVATLSVAQAGANALATGGGNVITVTGLTNTIFNGTWVTTSATSSTVVFSLTHANVASTADTGTLSMGGTQIIDQPVRTNIGALSVTNVALTSNVATLSVANSLPTGGGSVITVTGLTNVLFNGTWTTTSATSSTVVFPLTHANVSSTADTGTLNSASRQVFRDVQVLPGPLAVGAQTFTVNQVSSGLSGNVGRSFIVPSCALYSYPNYTTAPTGMVGIAL